MDQYDFFKQETFYKKMYRLVVWEACARKMRRRDLGTSTYEQGLRVGTIRASSIV